MKKYSIEIKTPVGWVTYHTIMRPGEERAQQVLLELKTQHEHGEFRLVKWAGEVILGKK